MSKFLDLLRIAKDIESKINTAQVDIEEFRAWLTHQLIDDDSDFRAFIFARRNEITQNQQAVTELLANSMGGDGWLWSAQFEKYREMINSIIDPDVGMDKRLADLEYLTAALYDDLFNPLTGAIPSMILKLNTLISNVQTVVTEITSSAVGTLRNKVEDTLSLATSVNRQLTVSDVGPPPTLRYLIDGSKIDILAALQQGWLDFQTWVTNNVITPFQTGFNNQMTALMQTGAVLARPYSKDAWAKGTFGNYNTRINLTLAGYAVAPATIGTNVSSWLKEFAGSGQLNNRKFWMKYNVQLGKTLYFELAVKKTREYINNSGSWQTNVHNFTIVGTGVDATYVSPVLALSDEYLTYEVYGLQQTTGGGNWYIYEAGID